MHIFISSSSSSLKLVALIFTMNVCVSEKNVWVSAVLLYVGGKKKQTNKNVEHCILVCMIIRDNSSAHSVYVLALKFRENLHR